MFSTEHPVVWEKLQLAVEKMAPFLPIGTLPDGRRIVQVDEQGVMSKRTGMRPAGDPFPGVMGWVESYREDFAAGIVILANHAAELLATIEAQEAEVASAFCAGFCDGVSAVDNYGDCDTTPEEALAEWQKGRTS